MKLPQYDVVEITGAAHKQTFKVQCTVAEWNISAQGREPPAAWASRQPLLPCWKY